MPDVEHKIIVAESYHANRAGIALEAYIVHHHYKEAFRDVVDGSRGIYWETSNIHFLPLHNFPDQMFA